MGWAQQSTTGPPGPHAHASARGADCRNVGRRGDSGWTCAGVGDRPPAAVQGEVNPAPPQDDQENMFMAPAMAGGGESGLPRRENDDHEDLRAETQGGHQGHEGLVSIPGAVGGRRAAPVEPAVDRGDQAILPAINGGVEDTHQAEQRLPAGGEGRRVHIAAAAFIAFRRSRSSPPCST